MGAAFGSGSSGSLFVAAGSANFLSRPRRFWRPFLPVEPRVDYFGSMRTGPKDIMKKARSRRRRSRPPRHQGN